MTKVITVGELREAEGRNLAAAGMLGGFGLLVKDSDYKESMNKELLQKLYKTAAEAEEIKQPEPYSHFDVIRKYLEG